MNSLNKSELVLVEMDEIFSCEKILNEFSEACK